MGGFGGVVQLGGIERRRQSVGGLSLLGGGGLGGVGGGGGTGSGPLLHDRSVPLVYHKKRDGFTLIAYLREV